MYVSSSQQLCGWGRGEEFFENAPGDPKPGDHQVHFQNKLQTCRGPVLPRRQVLLLLAPSDIEAFNLK